MKKKGFYSSGEFAKMARVTVRTIRYYDKQNILKPSFVDEHGSRYYTDADFALLQQILLLKYLGFSLDDIKEMLVTDPDSQFIKNSLLQQKKLIQDRIEQMHLVEDAIDDTVNMLDANKEVDWSQMLDLIHLTSMEKSLKSQYQNSSNISARIRLHRDYSVNKTGWFPWLFDLCMNSSSKDILELGCGDGALWTENPGKLSEFPDIHITLTDISEGMIRDVRRNIGTTDSRFSFIACDCHKLPFNNNSFDLIFANHVLFYCDDIEKVCSEVLRVLRPGGVFCCSTYGTSHMQEITSLVQEFDNRIMLSGEKLYEKFGLENGRQILEKFFSHIDLKLYDDEIIIDQAEPIIEYIISCHGNQNQYLLDRYHDFKDFVEKHTTEPFHITKEAGVFICHK